MSDRENFKLPQPELEADIYYLTEKEGGRKTAVATSYRGQFYYDNHNWDAAQQFLEKEWCQPGETVKVLMQTASPDFHCGKLFVGKQFEIREGARVVGKGTITKILRSDFNYWDGATFIKSLDKSIKPYSSAEDITGYRQDFDYLLPDEDNKIIEDSVEIEMTGKPECMMRVNAKAMTKNLGQVSDYVIDRWKNKLATRNHLYKTDFGFKTNSKNEIVPEYFKLTFATWHTIYLTGEIVVRL